MSSFERMKKVFNIQMESLSSLDQRVGELVKRRKDREEKGFSHLSELHKQRAVDDEAETKREKAQKKWDKIHDVTLKKALDRER